MAGVGNTQSVWNGEMGVIERMRRKNRVQDRGPEAGDGWSEV